MSLSSYIVNQSFPQLLKNWFEEKHSAIKPILFFCEVILLLFTSAVFIEEWIQYYSLHFQLDVFDGSLRLLSALYASHGFIPYKDFSFVYPPGLIFLSEFFHLNFSSQYHVLSFIFLIASIMLLLFFYRKTHSLFYTGLFVAILSATYTITGDPLIEVFWYSFITWTYFFIRENKKQYILPIIFFGIGVLFLKWERVFLLCGISLGLFILFFLLRKKNQTVTHLAFISFVILSVSTILFLVYCITFHINPIHALYFIEVVPIKILPYRKLPLPPFNIIKIFLSKNDIVYFSFLLWILFSAYILFFKKNHSFLASLFLILAPLPVFSYAIGRADLSHALPFFYTLLVLLLLERPVQKYLVCLLVIGFIYMIFAFHIVSTDAHLLTNTDTSPVYTHSLDSMLAECKKAVSKISYKTLFVGRISYSHYIINYPILYLINPAVKPATEYISDEPGLQNSCYDGANIVSELNAAQKPMLTYLDTGKQWEEPNETQTMKSCGNIEKWLSHTSYSPVGTCTVDNEPFVIRLYK